MISLSILAAGVCRCSSRVDMGAADSGQDTGQSDTDTDSESDVDADSDGDGGTDTDTGEEICDDDEFEIKRVAPNLLIMLDRSGTMVANVGISLKSRWEVCRDAITLLTNTYNEKIRFGLGTFSSCLSGGCSAGSIEVPIGEENAGQIQDFLNATAGEGSIDGAQVNDDGLIMYLCESGLPETSTGTTLAALVGEESLLDGTRENAVLLLTDGDENLECIQDEINGPAGAAALLAQTPSVRTFAVGFIGAELTELSSIATSGGTEVPYSANQPAELEAALAEIANGFVSCEYTIPGLAESADKNKVNFFFDEELVPYDEGCADGSGWMWSNPEKTEVTFCPEACAKMKNGEVLVVSATWGCDTVPIVG